MNKQYSDKYISHKNRSIYKTKNAMTNNKYILLSLILFLGSSINAQTFTKEQMFEDFDFLYGKLDSVNTRFPIVKEVTGTDILSDIQKIRLDIDTVTCDAGFYDCLYRAITLCKDMHVSFTGGYPYNNYDKAYIDDAQKKTYALYKSSVYRKYDVGYNPFQVYYVDGEYFTSNIYEANLNYIVQIPEKSKLLKINDLTINEYVNDWVVPFIDNPRWDEKNKQWYVKNILAPQRTNQSDEFRVTYSHQGETKEVNLKTFKIKFSNTYGGLTPKVLYFDKDKIMYVRIPSMDYNLIENYKAALLRCKDKEINKVVIDVRGNGGGSDGVWLNILASITGKSIPYPQTLAFRDNDLVKKYMKMDGLEISEDNMTFQIGDNTYFLLDDNGTIDPAEDSLGYNGTIYVLIDDGIFSSTLALTSVCQNAEQLVTVGTPSGYFGGQGVRPLYFIMPYSKLIFRAEYSLDCTNVREHNFIDYYHSNPEVPVSISLDDIFKTRDSGVELYGEDFLYNIDPVFRKVLEL